MLQKKRLMEASWKGQLKKFYLTYKNFVDIIKSISLVKVRDNFVELI